MYVKTGTYAGNSGTNPITGVGFAPVCMWIKRHGSTSTAAQVIKTNGVTHTKLVGFNATTDDTPVTLDSDGFTVLTAAGEVNITGGNYDYIAIGAVAADMAVFEYAGDGVDNTTVGSFGFTPDLVVVLPSSTVRPAWRSDLMVGDLSHARSDQAVVANVIQALQSGSIQVGTLLNAAGTTYYAAVFKKAAGVLSTAEYTGNGADNRDIAHGLGVTPTFIYLQSKTVTSQVGVLRFGTDAGDVTHSIISTADAANQIQAMGATNIQVGSSDLVNLTTGSPVYSFFTFADAAPVAGAGGAAVGGPAESNYDVLRKWRRY